jgi:MFS family permease
MEADATKRVGYLELLRTNRTYRGLFTANVLSQVGTWFGTIALFVLAAEVSGLPELAVGIVLVLRMFALALPQPFTGMLADRYSRKWLMVIAEVLAGGVVLLYLLVDGPEDWAIYYGCIVGQMVLHALFVPAETAALPSIVGEGEALVTANALNSATWSVALAFGASLGGFTVAAWGVKAAFLIDAGTFFLAAALLSRLRIEQDTEPPTGSILREGTRQILDGVKRIRATPPVYRILTAKALWSISGGGLIYCLVMLGDEIGGLEVAAGVGILFAARGVGSGLGPIVARSWLTDRSRWSFHLGSMVSLCGLFYVAVALVPWSAWIAVLVLLAHAASGANWVLSTVMLQERTQDDWRGRVFSADFLLMTTTNGLSSLGAALLVASGVLDLRQLVMALAVAQVAAGMLWLLLTRPGERRYWEEQQRKTPEETGALHA